MDIVYRRLKAHYKTEGKPEYRLPMSEFIADQSQRVTGVDALLSFPVVPGSVFLPLGLMLFGWGAERRLHWIVPNIGLFFIAAGMIGEFPAFVPARLLR